MWPMARIWNHLNFKNYFIFIVVSPRRLRRQYQNLNQKTFYELWNGAQYLLWYIKPPPPHFFKNEPSHWDIYMSFSYSQMLRTGAPGSGYMGEFIYYVFFLVLRNTKSRTHEVMIISSSSGILCSVRPIHPCLRCGAVGLLGLLDVRWWVRWSDGWVGVFGELLCTILVLRTSLENESPESRYVPYLALLSSQWCWLVATAPLGGWLNEWSAWLLLRVERDLVSIRHSTSISITIRACKDTGRLFITWCKRNGMATSFSQMSWLGDTFWIKVAHII